MKFDNRTRFPALLLRSVIDEERFTASVMARITYDLQGSRLVPSEEQPYIVSQDPWESPQGLFEQDQVLKTGGVDLFVFGNAYAPGYRPTIVMVVSVIVGDFRRDVRVYGPRRWQRSGRRLVPTSPETFSKLPLTLEYAYGGSCVWDEMEMIWPDNPEGLGFYIKKRQAEGNPLPQFEDPDQLIQSWDDRPIPAGFGMCPMTSGARLKSAALLDKEGQLEQILPRLFNRAHPSMVAPSVSPGAWISLLGMTPSGRLDIQLPQTLPMARLQLGEMVADRPLEIDQVGIAVEEQQVFVTYRFPFRYRLVREQKRSITLTTEEV